jgi:hypothetical protein
MIGMDRGCESELWSFAMMSIQSVKQLQRFLAGDALFCIYLDDVLDKARTQVIADMKRGFDKLAGPDFHMLFPTTYGSVTSAFTPRPEDYNLDLAKEICAAYRVPSDQLPMLIFPSVVEGDLLLAIRLDQPDASDAIRKIKEVTREVIRHKRPEDMTPEEFRANVVKFVKDNQLDRQVGNAALATASFVLLEGASVAFEKLLAIFT